MRKHGPPILLLLATALLYAPILDNWVYADDVDDWLRTVDPAFRWDLFDTSALALRPFELLVNALNVTLLGPEITLLAHLAGWAGHLLAVALVYAIARRLRLGPNSALFAAAFFALHPANVLAVAQVDTISQQLATLFPLALLAVALRRRPTPPIVISLLIIAILLAKETTLGFVAAWPFALVLLRPRQLARLPRYTALSVTFLALYVLFRLAAGPVVGSDGRYALYLAPLPLARNAATLAGAALYPGSTLHIFGPKALRGGSAAGWGIVLFVALAGSALLGLSLGARSDRRHAAGLALLAAAGLLPIIAISRVSELYAYALTPFIALFLASTAAGAVRVIYRRFPRQKRELWPFILLTLGFLAFATWGKVAALEATAVRARAFFDTTAAWSVKVRDPHLCVAAESGWLPRPYSGFFVHDRVLLADAVALASHLKKQTITLTTEADAPCDGVATFIEGVLIIAAPTTARPTLITDAYLPPRRQTPSRPPADRARLAPAQPAFSLHRLARPPGDG